MKSKKGQLLSVIPILAGLVIILALMVIGLLIPEQTKGLFDSVFGFLNKWWWTFPLMLLIFVLRQPLALGLKKLFGV